ncbi:hypothetical protein [Streptomyces sp. NPDC004528]|uniref:hypothetical protein n=1 Tax=Streptomyces sp. NPDC004528 TaxID=3154550 RepID=UPI0033B97492
MRRPDRGTLRAAGFTVLVAGVFLLVNAQVAAAADGSSGGMLAPLNVTSSEGVPIDGYELSSQGGSLFSFKSQAYAFIISGLFTLIRLVVGLSCWAIDFAFRFPLIKLLAEPAQKASDSYNHAVVDVLGLKGLLLAWAFVFGLIMFVRGKAGKGLGEIALTLVIAGFAASVFVRPDYLLATHGPLAQTQQAAAEVAQATVASHDWGGKITSDPGPCAGMAGRAELKCQQEEGERPLSATEVARPIQDSLTNALIVKGYMLLEYGRILDPGKASDQKAYALHLKWVTGGYRPDATSNTRKHACSLLRGPAKKYCEHATTDRVKVPTDANGLPALTTGEALLNSTQPVLSDEDQQFAMFLDDLKEKGGPVGKACAQYAAAPSGWRTSGALMLFIAALLICAIPLSAAVVLLGTQAADAAAAAVGGVTLVWAMLPGPSRQAAWKWLAVLAMSVAVMFAACMFLPFYGIGIDAVFTDGPDLPAERLLALDILALVGAAAHRWLMRGISSFGQRLAIRMRYAKIGGTHLPGDTSEIGAALAVHSSGVNTFGFSTGGGLRGLAGIGYGRLGTRQAIMQSLARMADGTGMPLDAGGVLTDAGAEVSRGLAPLALAGTGIRLGVRGAWGLLVGRRPDDTMLERLRKPVAEGDPNQPEAGGSSGSGGSGGRDGGRRGPADRYRDEDGMIVDPVSGQVLHDQSTHRTLLSTRAHNRLVRLRGYRLLHRSGRIAYGATIGLPVSVRGARSRGSQYTQDARQQVRVWGNTGREDLRAWGDAGREAAQRLRRGNPPRTRPQPLTPRPPFPPGPPAPPSGPASPSGPSSPWPQPTPRPPVPPHPTAAPAAPRRPAAPARPPTPPTPPATPPSGPADSQERATPLVARRRSQADLRRRLLDQFGAGDSEETRQQIRDEVHRRYGDDEGGDSR